MLLKDHKWTINFKENTLNLLNSFRKPAETLELQVLIVCYFFFVNIIIFFQRNWTTFKISAKLYEEVADETLSVLLWNAK